MSDTEVTYRWYAIQTTAGHENRSAPFCSDSNAR